MQVLMHKPDDTDVNTALNTTNLCLKSIVGHEKKGYNKTLNEVNDISQRIKNITAYNKRLNNIIRNLTTAVNMMIRLEWQACGCKPYYNDYVGAVNIMNKFGVHISGIN